MPRVFHCKPCNQLFSTGDSYDQHVEEKRAKGVPGHLFCHLCDQWMPNEKILAFHCRDAHPVDQELECPACKEGPISTIAAFMKHIERGTTCPIDLDRLNRMRDERMVFMRKLERQQGFKDLRDFSEFLCNDPSVIFPVQPVPHLEKWDTEKYPSDSEPFDWGTSGSDSKTTTESQREVFEGSSKDDYSKPRNFMPPGKNLGPGATADDCWNMATKRYNCPWQICLKSFLTPYHLINHLRGPAHSNVLYKCPGCMKSFKTLESLAAHATATTSLYCKFRHHGGFDSFIEQLTGGLIEVRDERNPDGSRRYRITQSSIEKFAKGVPGCNENDEAAEIIEFLKQEPKKPTSWDDVEVATSYDNWDNVPNSRLTHNTEASLNDDKRSASKTVETKNVKRVTGQQKTNRHCHSYANAARRTSPTRDQPQDITVPTAQDLDVGFDLKPSRVSDSDWW